jgi:hypothetical protein
MRKRLFFAPMLILLSALLLSACVHRKPERKSPDMQTKSIEQVFNAHLDALLSTPGVVGAGIAKLDSKPCIVVMVHQTTPDLENHVPKELEGYAVIIEMVGEFKIQDRD